MRHGNRLAIPRRDQRIFRQFHLARRAHQHDRALQFAVILIEIGRGAIRNADDVSAHRSVRARRPSSRSNRKILLRRRNDSSRRRLARPTVRDLPRFQMRVRKSRRFELFFRPMTRAIELRRTREPRPDAIREIRQIGFQRRFVFLHLLDDFLVHLLDGIGLRLGSSRSASSRRFRRGIVRKRPPRQQRRQLRRVVRPRRQHLRALIQIVFPHFVERVGLAVMRQPILRRILNAEKSRHAGIVERKMIRAVRTRHARLEQFQFRQRR